LRLCADAAARAAPEPLRCRPRPHRTQLRAVPRAEARDPPVGAALHGAVPAHAAVQAAHGVREREQRDRAVEPAGDEPDRFAAARAPAQLPPPPRGAGAHPGRGQRAGAAHHRTRSGRRPLADPARPGGRPRAQPARARALRRPPGCHCRGLARASVSAFADRVVAWQATHGRHDLPWQRTRDPYRVWLSEIMLQQTQVATVLDYYARFLQRFPDVRALAAAPLDDVLAAWSGLGYYSRARNLHRCAGVVVQRHGGEFPRSAAALAELPGIGT